MKLNSLKLKTFLVAFGLQVIGKISDGGAIFSSLKPLPTFRIWNEHMRVSSTDIMAPGISRQL